MELTNRKKRILRAIVEIYIITAEPVGSKAVAQQAGLDISTATIRNEMADLTEMGYLEQPHTSAGRVPSAAGYRLYVNELMDRHQLTLQETERINQALNVKMEELDRCLDQAGKVLSQISDYPVFTAAAPRMRVTVKRYDLLMVEENAFIAVVMTDNSVVKNKLIRIPDTLSDTQLQLLSTVLNSSFVGLTLEEMEDTLDKMETRSAPGAFQLISLVVQFAIEVLVEQRNQPVHTAGITHLLEHPEYRSLDKAKPLMNYLAEEKEASRLPVTLGDGQNMNILIGPENVNEALKDTSVVMASYDIGDNMRGVIGVVGPTRMDYAKVTARLSYFADSLTRMFGKGELAMYFSTSAGVQMFREQGIDATFLPFFSQNGEKWLMTTPYFQVALNRGLEQDAARREKAMQVLHVMLSEGAQEQILADGQDLLSYSQNVSYHLTHTMEDVRSVVEENHMYIRIASNDFFAISQDVVSKMIAGEYDAGQAYRAFNARLLTERTPDTSDIVLSNETAYSNVFHKNGGNASFSVMANTLRGLYGTDVLIAPASSFTGSVLQADYTQTTARAMIMPNGLMSYRRTMTGAELKDTLRAFVEGCEGGFTPFNRGSLPVVSGIAVQVQENGGSYTLTGITRGGQPLQDDDTVTVTCLATEKQMAPLLQDESRAFERGEATVRNAWSEALSGGSVTLAAPESYITFGGGNALWKKLSIK